MKKLVLLGALAVALFASPALAVNLEEGGHLTKVSDHSALYDPDTGEAFGIGEPSLDPADPIMIGSEQRTIFNVTTIYDGFSDSDPVAFDTSSPTELTGVLYDLEVIGVTVSGGQVYIDFGPRGRNPLIGDVDGDSIGAVNPTDMSTILYGGVLEVYEDAAKNYTPDPNGIGDLEDDLGTVGNLPISLPAGNGPDSWVEGGAGHVATTDGTQPVGADNFPTVTDGNYWLAAVLVELQYMVDILQISPPSVPFTDGTVMREILNLADGAGEGFAFANVVGGSFEGLVERGWPSVLPGILPDAIVDISLAFRVRYPRLLDLVDNTTGAVGPDGLLDTAVDTGEYVGPGYWPIDSQDPIVFSTIPEPATLSLLGMGLAGLIAARKRNRK